MKSKYLIYLGTLIISILIIWILGSKTKITTKDSKIQISDQLPTNNSTSEAKTTNTEIQWTNTSVKTDKSLNIYKTSKYISILNIDYMAEKFGFVQKDKISDSGKDIHLWKKGEETLIINLSTDTLTYHKEIQNNPITVKHTSEEIISKAKANLEKILDKQIIDNINSYSLTYLERRNVYTFLAPPDKANVFRLSYVQTINSLQTNTISETGAGITIYLNNNLDMYHLSLQSIFSNPQIDKQITVPSIEDVVKNQNEKFIKISTNSDLGTNFEIASLESINLKQNKIDIGYLLYPNIAIPSYIIQGDIKAESGQVNEVYALPLTPTYP